MNTVAHRQKPNHFRIDPRTSAPATYANGDETLRKLYALEIDLAAAIEAAQDANKPLDRLHATEAVQGPLRSALSRLAIGARAVAARAGVQV